MFLWVPSDDRARAASGRAGGSQEQSPAASHRQHQVHRRALQAQDVNGSHYARLCRQAAEESRRAVFGVPVRSAHHHRQGPGL